METKEFLSTVVDTQGYYCIVGIKTGKTIQKFYNSVDAAAEAAHEFDAEGYDAYYTPATYVEGVNRKAENVLHMKALFLDLDCGEDKPYPTQRDALIALQQFKNKYDLPTWTAIVNSGRGLHVYWILTRPHSREEWLPVAERLKTACIESGLEADPVVTADAARILRVPNTHNFKDDPARDVKVIQMKQSFVDLEVFAAKLPETASPVLPSKTYTDQDAKDMARAIGQNKYITKFSKLLIATASGKGCAQVNRAIMQPNDLSYSDWLHVLSIAKHCEEDGAQAIHLISSRYDGYSAEETEKVAAPIEYPHLCSTFASDNPSGCEGCPHRGKIKSPISLCKEIRMAETNDVEVQVFEEQTVMMEGEEALPLAAAPTPTTVKVSIPTYPYPYKRGAYGGVYLETKDDDGNVDQIEVYKRDLYVTKRLRDPIEGPSFEFKHHTDREGVQTFILPMTKLTSKDEFRKAMGLNDIFILPKQADLIMVYISRWIEQLKQTQDMVEVHTQFGWTEYKESFVLGDREIFANRVEHITASSRTMQYIPIFQKKGTLEDWKKITAFYNRPDFEEHQFMFGVSFGSPLMVFIPNISGAIYHLMSKESGYGKTTGMFGGASVWGHPKKFILKGKDTGNSGWNRAEIWKNFPLYIDEITNYKPDAASEFCYAATDGEQKNRMNNQGQNSERYRGKEWAMIIATTGNSSLHEILSANRESSQGEVARSLEASTSKKLFSEEDTALANTLQEDLAKNYGHAGEPYIQHILQNMDAVEKLILSTRDGMIKAAKLDSQHRYWVAESACTFAGCAIAKQLGLLDWDLDALYAWTIKKLLLAKENMHSMTVDIHALIADYIADHPRGILRVRSTDDARTTDPEKEHLILPDATPLYRWVGRHEYDINKLYLRPAPFKEWCLGKGHVFSAVRDLIKLQLKGKATKMRLGKGTKLNLPFQAVIELSWEDEVSNDAGDAD